MRLVTYSIQGRESVGVALDSGVLDAGDALAAAGVTLPPAAAVCMAQFLAWRPDSIAVLADATKGAAAGGILPRPYASLQLLAPVLRPSKIIGVGLNYAAHAAEASDAKQTRPRLFFKAPSSLIGPDAPIRKPGFVAKLDFEGELAIVIGRRAHAVAETDALDAVVGFTICNDVSAREFQFDLAPAQTSFAKSMDTFCPLGPWLVARDALPASLDLRLRTWLNDTLMQDARTGSLTFGVRALVAYVSRHMTLEPGDIITTGTPEGTGHFRTPPRYLGAADRIRIEIEGIGSLENPVA